MVARTSSIWLFSQGLKSQRSNVCDGEAGQMGKRDTLRTLHHGRGSLNPGCEVSIPSGVLSRFPITDVTSFSDLKSFMASSRRGKRREQHPPLPHSSSRFAMRRLNRCTPMEVFIITIQSILQIAKEISFGQDRLSFFDVEVDGSMCLLHKPDILYGVLYYTLTSYCMLESYL